MKLSVRRIIRFLRRAVAPVAARLPLRMTDGPAAGCRMFGAFGLSRAKERESDAYLSSLAYAGKVLWDVGASIGILSVFFASRTGDKGKVFCFEPEPEQMIILRKNRRINKIHWIDMLAVHIADADGTAQRTAPGSGGAASAVPVRTLDSLLREKRILPPDMVRIEMQGHVLAVLKGMRETLRGHSPELFIAMHGGHAADVVSFLMHEGYRIFHIEHDRDISGTHHEWASSGHIHCTPKRR